jgi:hypothetical protein
MVKGLRITEPQASAILLDDLGPAEDSVNSLVKVKQGVVTHSHSNVSGRPSSSVARARRHRQATSLAFQNAYINDMSAGLVDDNGIQIEPDHAWALSQEPRRRRE